jgi:putative endonuclease
MRFYIYILYAAANIYYVGYTNDVERKLLEHNSPIITKFTSKHLPWYLKVFFEVADNRSDAMKTEK